MNKDRAVCDDHRKEQERSLSAMSLGSICNPRGPRSLLIDTRFFLSVNYCAITPLTAELKQRKREVKQHVVQSGLDLFSV